MPQQWEVGRHATSVKTVGDITTVTYHSTDVVIVDRDKRTVTLNSDGWRTRTTKNRMNQAAFQFGLPFRVVQIKGEWHVILNGESIDFKDGMVISY